MHQFPHLKDSEFPSLQNVDVYQYRNELDYSRYDYSQMRICVCRVPWDMGEAHVGARTISGIGNVVYFADETSRDKWFSDIPDTECYRFETKFKELHRDNELIVPLPFDIACNYNYVTVEYSLFANDDSPLEYESANGLQKWFWFIREVEFVAPNATKLHLLNDAWQTFIYRVDIPYMILERGHAPLFANTVENYLGNPRDRCSDLLEPDCVLPETPYNVSSSSSFIFDDKDMYAVFVSSSSLALSWGTANSNSWIVPARAQYHRDGNLSYSQLAIATGDLFDFLSYIESNFQPFKQTVKCVYLVSSQLVTLGTAHLIGSYTLYELSATQKQIDLISLSKNAFGYDAKYKNLAKLYTYPYSYIEVSDENGKSVTVKIEETNGVVNIAYAFNSVFPTLDICAYLSNVSGNTGSITFKNLNSRNMAIGGRWFETQWNWAIPQFGVFLQASREYAYSGYFDRQQAEVEYTANYNSSTATNATAKTNSDNLASTAKSNVTLMTNNMDAIRALENTLRSNRRDATKQYIGHQVTENIAKLEDDRDADLDYMDGSYIQGIDAIAAGTISNAATGLGSSIALGGISGGPVGAGVGAVAGGIGAVASGVGAVISISKDQNLTILSKNNLRTKTTNASTNMTNVNSWHDTYLNQVCNNENATNKSITDDNIAMHNSQATNNKSTANTNASNTKTTADANALRTKNAAMDAVSNRTRQEGMKAPYEFGTWANGSSANVKAKGLFANLVTQSKAAIAYAGDEFLRYGYRYNRQWAFNGVWVPSGHKFAYWKLSDFWVKGLSVPDMYMDKLRFFLFGGVTVWKKPEDIGYYSIYENGV